jgi:sugar phosphate isomerase/epimerase
VNALAPGLCSVTMRRLGVEEVARLAAEAGLRAIEWGGDVHVPPGDADAAKRARVASGAAGVTSASYGSYLLADGDRSPDTVARVLDTAVDLGAPNVRVWTPLGVLPGSSRTNEVVDALGAVSAAAAERDLTVSIEFHGGTLTETATGAAVLLDAVGATNLSTYWQSPYWLAARSASDDVTEVEALAPRLSHVHVYEWAGADDRRPLREGTERWRAVLGALRHAAGPELPAPRVAFLEFVAADDPAALLRDARTLLDLLGGTA